MKSITCPNCNGTNIAEIMWGLPSGKFMEEYNKEENKGKYRLGGCCVSNDDPGFECNDCGYEFGRREDEYLD